MDILKHLNLSIHDIKTNGSYRIDAAIQATHTLLNESIKDEIGADEFCNQINTFKKISASVFYKYKTRISNLLGVVNHAFDYCITQDEIRAINVFLKYALLSGEHISHFLTRNFSFKFDSPAIYQDLLKLMYENALIYEKDENLAKQIVLADFVTLLRLHSRDLSLNYIKDRQTMAHYTLDHICKSHQHAACAVSKLSIRHPNNLMSSFSEETMDIFLNSCMKMCLLPRVNEQPFFLNYFNENGCDLNKSVTENNFNNGGLNFWLKHRFSEIAELALYMLNTDECREHYGYASGLFCEKTIPYGFIDHMRVIFNSTSYLHLSSSAKPSTDIEGGDSMLMVCSPVVLSINSARENLNIAAYLNMQFCSRVFTSGLHLVESLGGRVMDIQQVLNDDSLMKAYSYVQVDEIQTLLIVLGVDADAYDLFNENINNIKNGRLPDVLQNLLDKVLAISQQSTTQNNFMESNSGFIFDATTATKKYS